MTYPAPLPEARGPAVEGRATVVIEPRNPAEERDREMLVDRDRDRARCDRCLDLPDELVQALTAAIRTAVREGRPR